MVELVVSVAVGAVAIFFLLPLVERAGTSLGRKLAEHAGRRKRRDPTGRTTESTREDERAQAGSAGESLLDAIVRGAEVARDSLAGALPALGQQADGSLETQLGSCLEEAAVRCAAAPGGSHYAFKALLTSSLLAARQAGFVATLEIGEGDSSAEPALQLFELAEEGRTVRPVARIRPDSIPTAWKLFDRDLCANVNEIGRYGEIPDDAMLAALEASG